MIVMFQCNTNGGFALYLENIFYKKAYTIHISVNLLLIYFIFTTIFRANVMDYKIDYTYVYNIALIKYLIYMIKYAFIVSI